METYRTDVKQFNSHNTVVSCDLSSSHSFIQLYCVPGQECRSEPNKNNNTFWSDSLQVWDSPRLFSLFQMKKLKIDLPF